MHGGIRGQLEKRNYKQVQLREVYDDEELQDGIQITTPRLDEARRLLKNLNLRQKVRLLSGLDMWHLKPVPSLTIPALWVCDGPHGLRKQTSRTSVDLVKGRVAATCFPTASALACSWDCDLLRKVGIALGRECKAENVAVLLGPGINIIRTPLGGRNFEYFSEDPLLTGHLGAAMIDGIQSQGVAACAKHFCANNQETDRWIIDTIVDERTLREIYWKPWELVVRLSQPASIMCAYNKVNGMYCSENRVLNTRILRDEWGFQGVVMTDWGATNQRSKGIAAGVDMEMPGSSGAHDYEILEAFYEGTLKEEQVDQCAERVLALMLNGTELSRQAVRAVSHARTNHLLAYQAAVNSTVLLKNDDNLLPLKPGTSIAVIGNNANNPRIQGLGSSQVKPTVIESAFDRFQDHTVRFHAVQGFSDTENENLRFALMDEAVDIAKENQVVVIFLGIPDGDECEGIDRTHIDLPEDQEILLDKILDVNDNVVVVLTNGAPVRMPWAKRVPSILEGWLGGQACGRAIADIIFGESNPCGKLAQTFPLRLEDVPAAHWKPNPSTEQVQYREGLNVGYRYFNSADKAVLFPFGHGLTYTSFEYSSLPAIIATDTEDDIKVNVSVTVRNSGALTGAEIVQCYVSDCQQSLYRPCHELQAFHKIQLEPNESKTILFALDKNAFNFYDVGTREWVFEPGEFEVQVGASSRDIRLKDVITLTSGQSASLAARMAHPSETFPIDWVPDSDIDFTRMLGYEIPIPPTKTGLFDYDTLMRDIKTSTLGCRIYEFVMKAMERDMANPNDPIQLRIQHNMMDSMPLRGLVVFSRGMLNFDILDLLLSLMNGEFAYTKAICMAPALLLSWFIMRFFGVNSSV